jgi:hypothetical protein
VSDRFDRWWYDEGSGMTPADPSDIETHTRRVAEIAWSNGEYVASERHEAEIARLRTILAAARLLVADLRGGVERYSGDLCRAADGWLADHPEVE